MGRPGDDALPNCPLPAVNPDENVIESLSLLNKQPQAVHHGAQGSSAVALIFFDPALVGRCNKVPILDFVTDRFTITYVAQQG